MSRQVESRDIDDARTVQGGRFRQMPHGALRAARASSSRMDDQDTEISRGSLERVGPSSRGIHQQTRWRATQQVSFIIITTILSIVSIVSIVSSLDTILSHFHCRVERSSDQVIKPVNLEALTKWVGNIPEDVIKDMPDIAPMLSVLGYDPYANPPNYGAPDSVVSDNTRRLLYSPVSTAAPSLLRRGPNFIPPFVSQSTGGRSIVGGKGETARLARQNNVV